jgi:hypothetical protein
MKTKNLKIRTKERGTMIAMLIAKGFNKDRVLKYRTDSQLLSWMFQAYGYNHHKLWRLTQIEPLAL